MPNYEACSSCDRRLYRNAPFVPRDASGRKCATCKETSLLPTNYYGRFLGNANVSPKSPKVGMLCQTCPLHLEKGLYPEITRMGGKPLHCGSNKKSPGKGCYDMRQRTLKIKTYYRILEAKVEVEVPEEVAIHA